MNLIIYYIIFIIIFKYMVYGKNLTVERLTFLPFYDITVSNTATVYGALFLEVT